MDSLDFAAKTIFEIERGEIPLHHDSILKVCFRQGYGLKKCYFSCVAEHSGIMSAVILALPAVYNVIISTVDNFKP